MSVLGFSFFKLGLQDKGILDRNRLAGIDTEANFDLAAIGATKDDLAQFNDDFLCVPKSRITDFVTTSGTLSDPVAFYLTDADVERLATNEAQSFQCAGGTENDIYQLMTTIDRRFMAGLAYWMGARKMGGPPRVLAARRQGASAGVFWTRGGPGGALQAACQTHRTLKGWVPGRRR